MVNASLSGALLQPTSIQPEQVAAVKIVFTTPGAGRATELSGTVARHWGPPGAGHRASKAPARVWGNPPAVPTSPRDLTLPTLNEAADAAGEMCETPAF